MGLRETLRGLWTSTPPAKAYLYQTDLRSFLDASCLTPEEYTYADLQQLVLDSELITGQSYILSDFRDHTNGVDSEVYKIILTATSSNKFSICASFFNVDGFSLKYDFSNTSNGQSEGTIYSFEFSEITLLDSYRGVGFPYMRQYQDGPLFYDLFQRGNQIYTTKSFIRGEYNFVNRALYCSVSGNNNHIVNCQSISINGDNNRIVNCNFSGASTSIIGCELVNVRNIQMPNVLKNLFCYDLNNIDFTSADLTPWATELQSDYRKVIQKDAHGKYVMSYMDGITQNNIILELPG